MELILAFGSRILVVKVTSRIRQRYNAAQDPEYMSAFKRQDVTFSADLSMHLSSRLNYTSSTKNKKRN